MKYVKIILLIFSSFINQSIIAQNITELNWTGTLNDKIPINLKYTISDEIIVGEITYLETKSKTSIKILGTIEDESYRILEFEKNGNITGIITGKPGKKEFNGTWFSPKSGKSLDLKLKNPTKKEKNITQNVVIDNAHYQYAYGEEGYQGDFEIEKLKDNKFEFSIFSVTRDPSRNIAYIESDKINIIQNSFKYQLPDEESCEFQVTFYQDFLIVKYTKGNFYPQFGRNATIEGIYLKVDK